MDGMARGSKGRRLYTAEFKREQIARILRGEVTLAELRRGGETAGAAKEGVVPASVVPASVVPASELRAAQQ